MKRKFRATVSHDKGTTWKKVNATGWPITGITTEDARGNPHGYDVALDDGDTMVDIVIPERVLKLVLKDIRKENYFDDRSGTKEKQVNQ